MKSDIDSSIVEKFLNELEQEIENTENKINNSNEMNKKIHTIRKVKKTGLLFKYSLPILILNSLIMYFFVLINRIPFHRDIRENYLNILKEIDSLGNIRYEEQYKEYNYPKNKISVYNKWKIDKDGTYYREIETYNVKKLSEEEIINIVNSNNILSEEVLMGPTYISVERKTNISQDELEEESFIQATIYSKDKNNFILVKESTDENLVYTTAYLSSMVLLNIPLNYMNVNNSLKVLYKKIDEENPYVDVEELKRKLEIKKDNYNRLKG